MSTPLFWSQRGRRYLGQGLLLVIAFGLGRWIPHPAPHAFKALENPESVSNPHSDSLPLRSKSPAHETAHAARHPPSTRRPSALWRDRIATREQEIVGLSPQELLRQLRRLDHEVPGPERLWMRQAMVAEWAQSDPESALSYAHSLPNGEKEFSELTALTTWAEKDPSGAASHFAENADDFEMFSRRQRDSAAAIASAWSIQDPKAAARWVSSLPEYLRESAVTSVMDGMRKSDPDQVAGWISQFAPGYERTESIASLVEQQTVDEPSIAASWVESLQNPEEQTASAAKLTSTWAEQNPAQAAEWINTLPAGSMRDAATAALIQSPFFRPDSSTAEQWLRSITDPELRLQTLQSAALRWPSLVPSQ